MQRETLKAELLKLGVLFPSRHVNEVLIDEYFRYLQHLPDDILLYALAVIVSTSKFFPAVSEIIVASNAIIERRANKAVGSKKPFCSECLNEGVILMWYRTDHKVNDYFLCPKGCHNVPRRVGKFKPVSEAGAFISRQELVNKWFAKHPENPYVVIAQRAIDKLDKATTDAERDKINADSLKEFNTLLGINNLPPVKIDETHEKPWAYPKQFAK